MAKQDGGKHFDFQEMTSKHVVFQDMMQTSTDEAYTLENLPDEFRKMLPPDLINGMRPGPLEIPGLDALQRNDPAFDQMAYLQRVGTIISAVRDAEQNGQWDIVRPFMSQRFFRRWQLWAQGLGGTGSARPTNLSRQIALASVQSEAGYDRVSVRVAESSVPATHPPVSTLWVFLRSGAGRRGHQSETFAAVCTNCCAPVDATNQSTCRYCGAGVASLGPEWVLDDVTADARPSNLAA